MWEAYGQVRGPTQLRTVLELLGAGRLGVARRRARPARPWLLSAPGDEGQEWAREAYDMAVRVDAPGARDLRRSVVALTVRNLDPSAQLAFNEEALALAGAS